ncbi:TetR/AcrR family transcriptional regulator [Emcibacter nanhaiensis]|uniref:TetR/AcrR family transcriptional regulator n=1 Tax=Emcibacter nanhaiensis TaxID=1505037 RepID=A0A501PSK5_9PROT|nr:TetR/AcrR family transcriptional regulator [Emcibacter nanhaiensis]TPD63235.1 TetR/AcrR family transcriptional regulator [Emcibacter nanhaiensis]
MKNKAATGPDQKPLTAAERMRQAKIDQIVSGAIEAFLEDGFAVTSMDKIAEKAGVSKRTVYNYYPSKEEIFTAVMEMQLAATWGSLNTEPSQSVEWKDQLRLVGIGMLQVANSPVTLSLFRTIIAEAMRFPDLARKLIEKSVKSLLDDVSTILDHAVKNSELQIADTKLAGEYFLDVLTGTAYQIVLLGVEPPMKDKEIRERAERALDYLQKTFAIKPA